MVILAPSLAFSASNTFAPPPGKTLLIVGQDYDTLARYVGATGNIPGGVSTYTNIQKADGLEAVTDYGSGPMNGKALLAAYPNSAVEVGLYMVDGLDNALAGKYDLNLKRLAGWIKSAARPVYLRIGYEFDNPGNYYDPEKYKRVFRYVVDLLRKEGVRNAAYVWHSYCWVVKPGQQLMDWYPGDDYVDWFGASVFALPDQLRTTAEFIKLAREHHKPFMICESTPWGVYTLRGKVYFLNRIFQFIKDEKIEAFCYIDSDWDIMPMYKGQHIGDARLEEIADIKLLWLNEIAQDRYLKASPDLFRVLGLK